MTSKLISRTAEVVAAYVANNIIPVSELPKLISETYASLADLGKEPSGPLKADAPVPAVPIKKSVTPDFIVCLEDGKKMKMLKRHLMTRYGMTPDDYRTKWGLPKEYPMVAPNYAIRRAETARAIGLGRRHKKAA